MGQSNDSFTGDGVTTDYFYTFDIDGSFNTVRVGTRTADEPDFTVAVEGTDYLHIPASKQISFLTASIPANGVIGLISRVTTRDRNATRFIDGTNLTPDILNSDANRLATVDPEIEDRVIQVRQSEPLVADMPIVATPTTLDMGIAADVLLIQGKIDGTNDAVWVVRIPAEGDTVELTGTGAGAPELRFELNSDDTMIDLTMVTANSFTAWTLIKMVALKMPLVANL